MANQKTKILSPEKLSELRKSLPRSWLEAAGILTARKRVNPLLYQKRIRKEWEKRLRRLSRISRFADVDV